MTNYGKQIVKRKGKKQNTV